MYGNNVMYREYEIIGGESHSLIVYTYEKALYQVNDDRHHIQAYFPFPPISKVDYRLYFHFR